jgi:hypothetical protein
VRRWSTCFHWGHTDIGFIAGPQTLNSAQGRKDAFTAALREHGLHVRKEWIAAGDMRVDGGRTAMQRLLSLTPRPTAVLASNDLMAVGALQAAHAAHIRVPRELSIIGFDDLPIAGMMHPPLSTIRHPRREVARRAFEYLWKTVQGEEVESASPTAAASDHPEFDCTAPRAKTALTVIAGRGVPHRASICDSVAYRGDWRARREPTWSIGFCGAFLQKINRLWSHPRRSTPSAGICNEFS